MGDKFIGRQLEQTQDRDFKLAVLTFRIPLPQNRTNKMHNAVWNCILSLCIYRSSLPYIYLHKDTIWCVVKHCTTFQFAAVCKTLGTTHLVSKNRCLKIQSLNTPVVDTRWTNGRQPYVRPGRNNEYRWNSRVGTFTLSFVSYKVQRAVPFDCQSVCA